MNENLVSVRVWGDFACFTRPEMKVERVSYPIMTPSAGRGVLEAIFWEPEVYYVIHSIRVVKKGLWTSFLRNEVTKVLSVNNVLTWMRNPARFDPVCSGGGARDGTQRNMLALEDVEYLVSAEMHLTGLGQRSNQKLRKYPEEFERRATQGKCFHRPCLGMREFAADFEWEPDPQAALERRAAEIRADGDWRSIWPHEELGLMLYDLFDHEDRLTGFRWLPEEDLSQQPRVGSTSGIDRRKRGRKAGSIKETVCYEGKAITPQATFFHAVVRDAAMECNPAKVRLFRKRTETGGDTCS
jgi:CRISPR-associated protein Cas5d